MIVGPAGDQHVVAVDHRAGQRLGVGHVGAGFLAARLLGGLGEFGLLFLPIGVSLDQIRRGVIPGTKA